VLDKIFRKRERGGGSLPKLCDLLFEKARGSNFAVSPPAELPTREFEPKIDHNAPLSKDGLAIWQCDSSGILISAIDGAEEIFLYKDFAVADNYQIGGQNNPLRMSDSDESFSIKQPLSSNALAL
jgi:hypothetical protein